jgi:hypothetical protein
MYCHACSEQATITHHLYFAGFMDLQYIGALPASPALSGILCTCMWTTSPTHVASVDVHLIVAECHLDIKWHSVAGGSEAHNPSLQLLL